MTSQVCGFAAIGCPPAVQRADGRARVSELGHGAGQRRGRRARRV